MDISQLRTLAQVAELGSVSRAADRLGVAQPALSRHILNLEQELGTDLFERRGRGMAITDMGREVLAHAVRIIAEVDAIRDAVAPGRTSLQGSLTIGTTSAIAETIGVPLVARMRERHPGLSLRLASGHGGHVLEALRRGQVDVAVAYDPGRPHALRIVPIMLESLLLISADARDGEATVPFASLATRDLVLPSPGHMIRDVVDECARRAGIQVRTVAEADSIHPLINLVRAGVGATVLPSAPVHPLLGAGDLSAAALSDPAPTRRLVMALAADRPVSPAARLVGETIVEMALDLARRGVWVGRMPDAVADP